MLTEQPIKLIMLHGDVVEAVENKQFKIYTVESVDDALELLMGMDIGVVDSNGNYTKQKLSNK